MKQSRFICDGRELVDRETDEVIMYNYNKYVDDKTSALLENAPELLDMVKRIYSFPNLKDALETRYSRALVYDLLKDMETLIKKAQKG